MNIVQYVHVQRFEYKLSNNLIGVGDNHHCQFQLASTLI